VMTDPLADMLTRIRNAGKARHAEVRIPASQLKHEVVRVLSDAGYLGAVRAEEDEGGRSWLVVELRYSPRGEQPLIDTLTRISRPGRRVYVRKDAVPRVRNGLGLAVLSTSKGVLSDRAAREAQVGGELLCEVW